MTCHGCQEYQPTYETCRALAGSLQCRVCGEQWEIAKEGGGCPVCPEFSRPVDLSQCDGAVPSAACKGFVGIVVEPVQRELF